MKKRFFITSCRWAVAAAFIWSAAAKLASFSSPLNGETMFGALVGSSTFARGGFVAAELMLGLWLLSGLYKQAASYVSLFVLALFTGAIALEMTKPHPRPCGCRGAAYVAEHDPARIRSELAIGLAANVALMGLTVAGFKKKQTKAPPAAIPAT